MKRIVPFQDSILGQLDLPNLITLSGAVFGLLGLWRISADQPDEGMLFLLCAGMADVADGPLARRMKRPPLRSRVGQHLDSLCDLSSFGVIPAAMGLILGFTSPLALVVLGAFLAAAALRLAFFDSQEMEVAGATKYFIGLPSTFSALLIPAAYLVLSLTGTDRAWLLAVYAFHACAMVAPIRVPKSRGAALFIPLLTAVTLQVVYALASFDVISIRP